jgi:hypothetical protein
MGAVFALASATIDITTARPEAVATGMRMTFAVAAILIVVALAIAAGGRTGSTLVPSGAEGSMRRPPVSPDSTGASL